MTTDQLLSPIQYLLGGFSGGLVGFTLGLVGGGGSILAVPLILYLVGVKSPHVAIGTSALAVAANAAMALGNHARRGTVEWRCAGIYAGAGVVGALLGSTIGKAVDGQRLLLLFGLLMLGVAGLMLGHRRDEGSLVAACERDRLPRVLSFGGMTGMFSGFFGIGGGFLVVPGLMASTGMPMLSAVGSSLVAVTAFGLTTALNYAFSGFVDWRLAAVFVAGGFGGTWLGARAASLLAVRKGMLNSVFAVMICVVAVFVIQKSTHG